MLIVYCLKSDILFFIILISFNFGCVEWVCM